MIALLFAVALCAVPIWLLAIIVKPFTLLWSRRRGTGRRPGHLRRWSAGMIAAAALIVYLLGVGWLAVTVNDSEHGTDSSPSPSCRHLMHPPAGPEPVGFKASYVPLGFDCLLEDGSSVPSSRGWLATDVAVGILGGAAVALLIPELAAAGRRGRREFGDSG